MYINTEITFVLHNIAFHILGKTDGYSKLRPPDFCKINTTLEYMICILAQKLLLCFITKSLTLIVSQIIGKTFPLFQTETYA